MKPRTQKILTSIIKEYTRSAQPVSSAFLAEKFKVSSATMRNEMADLEKEGYIYQPHTSAGRVPTEKGYLFYIENFLQEKKFSNNTEKEVLKKLNKISDDHLVKIKELAKSLADISGETVLVGFTPNNVYYTGLSNLFSKPEFSRQEIVCNVSQIIDHLDEVMHKLFNQVGEEIEILVGRKNPFGTDCSTIFIPYKLSKKEKGLLGILGPMRMDYNSNMSLLKYAREVISKF